MKAVRFHEFGGLDVLRVEEIDDPRPGGGEVLVGIRAAGLNQITVTAGNWKPKTEDVGAAGAHQGDARDTLELPVPELMLEPESAGDVVAAALAPEGLDADPGHGGQDEPRRDLDVPDPPRFPQIYLHRAGNGSCGPC